MKSQWAGWEEWLLAKDCRRRRGDVVGTLGLRPIHQFEQEHQVHPLQEPVGPRNLPDHP